MKELTIEENKKLLLNLLINVASFCDNHQIKYSIAYGTLIGAIRHKGFIPWDDDIDIIMMRDDYERFCSLYKDTRYIIVRGDNQPNHLHVRVSDSATMIKHSKKSIANKYYKDGLWIDVFPIDKVPDSLRGYRFHKRIVQIFAGLRQTGEIGGKNFLKRMARLPLKPFAKVFGRLAEKRMVRYNKTNKQTVANLGVYYLNFPPFPLSYMNDFIDVEFDGHTFKAIKEYDAFLRGVYGDYMQFPPENKRIAHHHYKAYLKE